MQDDVPQLRGFFAKYIVRKIGIRDPRIEAAFEAVPRELFAGPGPWSIFVGGPWSRGFGYIQTPDDNPSFLYQDVPIGLDPSRGMNIGEPSLHARCLNALDLQPGEIVLQVGAGTGYCTALLAHLVGDEGRVHAYEIDADLSARAEQNLAAISQVTLHACSGIADHLPKANAIYVNAGITQPSWAWIDALLPGGRLLFPLQPRSGYGAMLLVTRPMEDGAAWPARFVARASFISCDGLQDDTTGRELSDAFAEGGWRLVKALRLVGSPDESCWFKGDGWWLSTATLKKDLANE